MLLVLTLHTAVPGGSIKSERVEGGLKREREAGGGKEGGGKKIKVEK